MVVCAILAIIPAKQADLHVRRIDLRVRRIDLHVKRIDLHVRQIDLRVKRIDLHVKQIDLRVIRTDLHVRQIEAWIVIVTSIAIATSIAMLIAMSIEEAVVWGVSARGKGIAQAIGMARETHITVIAKTQGGTG